MWSQLLLTFMTEDVNRLTLSMTPLHVKCIKLLGQVARIKTLAFNISFKCHISSFEGSFDFQLCLWQRNKCRDILQLCWWRQKQVSQNMIHTVYVPDIDQEQQWRNITKCNTSMICRDVVYCMYMYTNQLKH